VCTQIEAPNNLWVVQCNGVNATNVGQVTAVLDDLKTNEPNAKISLEVTNSEGSVLPDGLFAGYNIVSILMRYCGFTSIPFGLISTLPDDLYNLDLDLNQISDIDFDQLNALPFAQSLQKLQLVSNRIASLPEDAFVNLSSLTRLDLKDNLIEELLDNTFRGLESLQELYLYDNRIKRVDKNAFATLDKLLYPLSGHQQH